MDRPSITRHILMRLSALFVGTFIATGSASAAIIYNSSLERHSANFVYATGTNFVTGSEPVAGGGVISGTVDMVGTQINLAGNATTGAGTSAGIDARGKLEFNDLIFTDISNPTATGSINVSANFFYSFSPAIRMIMQSAMLNPFALNQQVNGGGTGVLSSSVVPVPLNTLITFSMTADLRVNDTTSGPGGNSATGVFQLADIPFFLPEGYTVNSIDAGIVDNSLTLEIPEPAVFPLVLAGLAGLGAMRRRRAAA